VPPSIALCHVLGRSGSSAQNCLPAYPNLDKFGTEGLFPSLITKPNAGTLRICISNERKPPMTEAEVDERIRALIAPFNKKEVTIEPGTTFANDLEFDSLTVMDFVAEIEDEFDIVITMNQQAEIETYGQLVSAVHKMQDS